MQSTVLTLSIPRYLYYIELIVYKQSVFTNKNIIETGDETLNILWDR